MLPIQDGSRQIDGIQLNGAAITTKPANKATLGTASSVDVDCPGSMCMQLSKQLTKKLKADKLPKKEEKKEEEKRLEGIA